MINELFSGYHPFAYHADRPVELEKAVRECVSPVPSLHFAYHHPLLPEWDVPPVIVDLITECTLKISGARPNVDQLLERLQEEITMHDMLCASIQATDGNRAQPVEAWSPWKQVYLNALNAQAAGQYETAFQLYDAIIQSNHQPYCAKACTDCGLLMMQRGRDFHHAIRLLEYGSRWGHERAKIALIQYIFRGSAKNHVPPDPARAIGMLHDFKKNPNLGERSKKAIPQLEELLNSKKYFFFFLLADFWEHNVKSLFESDQDRFD